MKRPFLITGERAEFCQPPDKRGPQSAVVYGPCSTIEQAWREASDGYDMDHIVRVYRSCPEDRHIEDVTDQVADELAFVWARDDLPLDAAPAFLEHAHIAIMAGDLDYQFTGTETREAVG